jgi:trehalose-6-phosphate synthase
MNLVAKEFIACQVDEGGVLVLSQFTGAAEEIEGAVLINPFNVDGFAQSIRRAIEMPEPERRERMRRMRAQLRGSTIFDWLDAILTRATHLVRSREIEVERERRLRLAAPGIAPSRPPYREGRGNAPGPGR